MRRLDIRANIVVPNVHWGVANLHECDILKLSTSGYATEIEIKISKYDLLKDKEKKHGHKHNHIKHLYFCVPESLEEIALNEISENAGILIVYYNEYLKGFRIKEKRKAVPNKNAVKWNEKEILLLCRLGTMRILGLKEKILSQRNTIESLNIKQLKK